MNYNYFRFYLFDRELIPVYHDHKAERLGGTMKILESIVNAYGLYGGLFITVITYLYYFSMRSRKKNSRSSSLLRTALSLIAAFWVILVILAFYYDVNFL